MFLVVVLLLLIYLLLLFCKERTRIFHWGLMILPIMLLCMSTQRLDSRGHLSHQLFLTTRGEKLCSLLWGEVVSKIFYESCFVNHDKLRSHYGMLPGTELSCHRIHWFFQNMYRRHRNVVGSGTNRNAAPLWQVSSFKTKSKQAKSFATRTHLITSSCHQYFCCRSWAVHLNWRNDWS